MKLIQLLCALVLVHVYQYHVKSAKKHFDKAQILKNTMNTENCNEVFVTGIKYIEKSMYHKIKANRLQRKILSITRPRLKA